MVEAASGVRTFSPKAFKEAVKIRADYHALPLAGGTDLMVKYRKPAGNLPDFKNPVIFIGQLDELKYIETDSKVSGEILHIGSGTKLSALLENAYIPEILKEAVSQIAAPGIRNMATIGGNICNSSPAGDTIPVLYCLDAVLVLTSENGEREVAVDNFIKGPGKNDLKSDELLREIKFPLKNFDRILYRKVGTRKANALSKLSFAGLARLDAGKIEDLKIAFGAVAPVVIRSQEIEKTIVGKNQSEISKGLAEIKKNYGRLIRPIDDQRSTAVYRKETALKLLEYFLAYAVWAEQL